jgi:hypothetical protein
MLRPPPNDPSKESCDWCGKSPARWYGMVFASTYQLGEMLCDQCRENLTKQTAAFRSREGQNGDKGVGRS